MDAVPGESVSHGRNEAVPAARRAVCILVTLGCVLSCWEVKWCKWMKWMIMAWGFHLDIVGYWGCSLSMLYLWPLDHSSISMDQSLYDADICIAFPCTTPNVTSTIRSTQLKTNLSVKRPSSILQISKTHDWLPTGTDYDHVLLIDQGFGVDSLQFGMILSGCAPQKLQNESL